MDMAGLDIEHLAARLSQHPQSPLFARLADLYLAERRVSDALALCEHGVQLYPSYASGHVMLGKCYSAMGRVGEARSAFHQALDLAPYNTVVQNLLITLPDRVEEEPPVTAPPAAIEELAPAAAAPVVAEEEDVRPLETIASVQASEPVQSRADIPEPPQASEPVEPRADIPEPPQASEPLAAETVSEEDTSIQPEAAAFSMEPEPLPAPDAGVAETEEPPFEPYPTFEEYIAQHPAQAPVMTLEDYLKGRVPAPPQQQQQPVSPAPGAPSSAPETSTDFESIALKLQNAGRIVPADQTLPAPPPPPASAPADTASGMQSTIVTQTMAEIYAAQNEYQAAIDAYEELIRKQPDQAKAFQQRIDAIRLLMGTV